MRKLIHHIYYAIGWLIHSILLSFWRLRDRVFPPPEDSILFVAHPDDETLFFYSFIKSNRPYVVLMTDGWSLRRLPEFIKAMRMYKVRYRAYNLHSRDKRIDLIEKYVREAYLTGKYDYIASHNSSGEYGHEMHVRVHEAVKKVVKKEFYMPISKDSICNYPLDTDCVIDKEIIFMKYYKSELFVLDQYREWVVNEKIIKQ
jgi:hypothetical protein